MYQKEVVELRRLTFIFIVRIPKEYDFLSCAKNKTNQKKN